MGNDFDTPVLGSVVRVLLECQSRSAMRSQYISRGFGFGMAHCLIPISLRVYVYKYRLRRYL